MYTSFWLKQLLVYMLMETDDETWFCPQDVKFTPLSSASDSDPDSDDEEYVRQARELVLLKMDQRARRRVKAWVKEITAAGVVQGDVGSRSLTVADDVYHFSPAATT